MAIAAGSLIEIVATGKINAQQWMNVWTYRVVGSLGTPTPANIGEAWWNHMKVNYRLMFSDSHTVAFEAVRVREMDSATGDYGEFAIPVGERAGTGTVIGLGLMPPFVALSIRFTVATRVTRPGQKRIPGAAEGDANSTTWEAAYVTKAQNLATTARGRIVLGAPAVGTDLDLVVVKKDPNSGLPLAHQLTSGFLINQYISSQVSRKIGRGI